MLSINQINGQMKVMKIWKALNIPDYPLKIIQQSTKTNMISTRACTNGKLIEYGKSFALKIEQHTIPHTAEDTAHPWILVATQKNGW